jgi:hypothetical protein
MQRGKNTGLIRRGPISDTCAGLVRLVSGRWSVLALRHLGRAGAGGGRLADMLHAQNDHRPYQAQERAGHRHANLGLAGHCLFSCFHLAAIPRTAVLLNRR